MIKFFRKIWGIQLVLHKQLSLTPNPVYQGRVMSEEEDIHPIFLKDPEEWMQYVYKKVSVLRSILTLFLLY